MIDKETEQKIADVIADALRNHNEICIKGIGTFSVQHQKQCHHQAKDGRVQLTPPYDVVSFDADN